MDIDLIRKFIPPVVSVLVLFVLKPLLTNRGDEAAGKRIAEQHPWLMAVTKALFFAGFAPTFVIYAKGILPDNDWRGLGVGMLFCTLLPTLFTVAYSRIARAPLGDLYTAIREGMPRPMVAVMFAFFIIPGVWATLSLLLEFVL